jgi:hypothetical protein
MRIDVKAPGWRNDGTTGFVPLAEYVERRLRNHDCAPDGEIEIVKYEVERIQEMMGRLVDMLYATNFLSTDQLKGVLGIEDDSRVKVVFPDEAEERDYHGKQRLRHGR